MGQERIWLSFWEGFQPRTSGMMLGMPWRKEAGRISRSRMPRTPVGTVSGRDSLTIR
jgi:hypothetical protein